MIQSYSYLTSEQFESYIHRDRRLYEEWNLLTPDQKQLYLNESARILDSSFNWAGAKVVITQILEFPRIFTGQTSSYDNEIPVEIKDAQGTLLLNMLRLVDYEQIKQAHEIGLNYSQTTSGSASASGQPDYGNIKTIPDAVWFKVQKFTLFHESYNPDFAGLDNE